MGALADTALGHEFPSLDRDGLVYLDSAATSQTPRCVLDAMAAYYESHRASVHRGMYPLAVEATELFEGARDRVARWLGWDPRATIFTRTRGATLRASALLKAITPPFAAAYSCGFVPCIPETT